MTSVEELERKLTTPSLELVKAIADIKGDIIILGVGGKMGPSLAKLAVRAAKEAGIKKRIIGVSRFSDAGVRDDLERFGVEVITADILNNEELRALPEVENVIFMAGKKFGTTGNEHFTWAMNTYLPGMVGEKFKNSRIVVFSSGNVYPFLSYGSGGATEDVKPDPMGEYAQSCLGRERIFEYYSHKFNIKMLIYRLNYAIDLRYGTLLEIAKLVKEEKPIDLTNGHLNVIWQGDANEVAIRSLLICESPPKLLNVTGPETLSVRWIASEFGKIFKKVPEFVNSEAPTSLLNNASQCHSIFGYPKVSIREMIEWTALWVDGGGETIDKPTHFQERSGNY